MHVQPSPRQDAAPRLVLWDPAVAVPGPAGAGQTALAEGGSCTADSILLYDPATPAGDRADHLRLVIEMQPWARITASGRWVPVLVDLAARHLHLCIASALLYEPRFGTGGQAPHLIPLPFPTEVEARDLRPLRAAIRAWGSTARTAGVQIAAQTAAEGAGRTRPVIAAAGGLCPA